MISAESIATLKAAMPDVLRHYGVANLGRNFSSPWREDRDPSCKFYADTNLVTDYGEGVTVDVFGLVGRVEGVSCFADQVRIVSQIVGHDLDECADYSPKAKAERPPFEPPATAGFPERPIKVFEELHQGLRGNKTACLYLRSRGFDWPTIGRNCLGWVPNRTLLANNDGTPMFTKYEPNAPYGFIVLPFMNRERTSANYAMLRTIPGENPPESKELRPTGYKSVLYREWLLSARCRTLYVCEGLLDTLALESLLRRPCVGLGGANLTKRLASVLYATPKDRRPGRIVLALDADRPGREAAARAASDLDALGIPHGFYEYPAGCKDACDLLKLVGGASHA